jgi:hypothetical protein
LQLRRRRGIHPAGRRDHTCALLDDATLKCWGDNFYGRLGLGNTNDRGDDPGEMGDNLPAIALGTGRTAACAMLDDADTCHGNNGRDRARRCETAITMP